MIFHITLDVSEFEKNITEFQKEKDKGFASGNYVDSMNFEIDFSAAFMKTLQDQVKENVKSRLGPEAKNTEIDDESRKIMEKIEGSPVGYSLTKFGLAEFLKNGADENKKITLENQKPRVTTLDFILKINEKASALDPNGIEMLVIDNGQGFPKSYLEKDSDKKNNKTILANVRKIKDPEYKEENIESSTDILEHKKNISDKQLSGEINAGIGLNELAKVVSVRLSKEPEKVLGHMLVGNVDDLEKTSYISLVNEAKFTLPEHGAIAYFHSPILNGNSIEQCEVSTRFREFRHTQDASKQSIGMTLDDESPDEEYNSDMEGSDVDKFSHLNIDTDIEIEKNIGETKKGFSLSIDPTLESHFKKRNKEKLTLSFNDSDSPESPSMIKTEPMQNDGWEGSETPTGEAPMETPRSETPRSETPTSETPTSTRPFSLSISSETPRSAMTPSSSISAMPSTPLSSTIPSTPSSATPLSTLSATPATPLSSTISATPLSSTIPVTPSTPSSETPIRNKESGWSSRLFSPVKEEKETSLSDQNENRSNKRPKRGSNE